MQLINKKLLRWLFQMNINYHFDQISLKSKLKNKMHNDLNRRKANTFYRAVSLTTLISHLNKEILPGDI